MKATYFFQNLKYVGFIAFMSLLAFGLSSCDEEDDDDLEDDMDDTEQPIASIDVNDQFIHNTVVVESVTMSDSGWVVIRRDNGNGSPEMSDIISEPTLVNIGNTQFVEAELEPTEEVENGETIWVMLNTDTGVPQTYEFDGESGIDPLISDTDGNPIMASLTKVLPTGSIVAEDQNIVSSIFVQSTIMSDPGWVVVREDNGGSPLMSDRISVPHYVGSGTTENFEVALEDGETVSSGDTAWLTLHVDSGAEEVYEYDENNELDFRITEDDEPVAIQIQDTE